MRKLGFYFATSSIALSLLALMPASHVKAADQNIAGTWIVTVTVNTPPGASPFVFTEYDRLQFRRGPHRSE